MYNRTLLIETQPLQDAGGLGGSVRRAFALSIRSANDSPGAPPAPGASTLPRFFFFSGAFAGAFFAGAFFVFAFFAAGGFDAGTERRFTRSSARGASA